VIVGGGAAGFFAAITCAEAAPAFHVVVLEKGSHFLSKVRISGGGRCNVTHSCFDPRELSTHYPRGGQALLGPFSTFQAADTVEWFESRGVKLKTEKDGRMFPVTDSSQTIIDCLVQEARKVGVELRANCSVERVLRAAEGGFHVDLAGGQSLRSDCLMLATGGCRAPAAGALAVSLGHNLEPPVPSLFSFHTQTPWLHELAGNSVENIEAAVPQFKLCEHGPVLITHQGLSGPVILRLSAWGARQFNQANYEFLLRINWVPGLNEQELARKFAVLRGTNPARLVANVPLSPLSARLWAQLVATCGISRDTRWANLSSAGQRQLVQQLTSTELAMAGRTLNRDEFVTCGGVRLSEVKFKTMESRICPGLYFGGELLDIDGLTGGFNFQAAWTTGWLAGRAMASRFGSESHDQVESGR